MTVDPTKRSRRERSCADTAASRPRQRVSPFLLWWVVSPDIQGVFIALDGGRRWMYLFIHDPLRQPVDRLTPHHCAEIVRQVAGTPELDVGEDAAARVNRERDLDIQVVRIDRDSPGGRGRGLADDLRDRGVRPPPPRCVERETASTTPESATDPSEAARVDIARVRLLTMVFHGRAWLTRVPGEAMSPGSARSTTVSRNRAASGK